jgi:hypothetical protein
MEYLEGQTLAERIVTGPLLVTEVVRIGVEIANALEAAHRAGITDRDLKPRQRHADEDWRETARFRPGAEPPCRCHA